MTRTSIDAILSRADYRRFLSRDLAMRGLKEIPQLCRWRRPLVYHVYLLRQLELYENTLRGPFRTWAKYLALRYKNYCVHLGVWIPPNVFGPGLHVVHWGSVVVSHKARVGACCRLHSCTNIGEYGEGAPVIGNDCYIGPGAKLFGKITIGNNVSIGANAVVNRSFPDNVTIGGVPAKILKERQ